MERNRLSQFGYNRPRKNDGHGRSKRQSGPQKIYIDISVHDFINNLTKPNSKDSSVLNNKTKNEKFDDALQVIRDKQQMEQLAIEEKIALEWPQKLQPAFAISIRPERFTALQNRLGPWSRHFSLWEGTNGNTLNPRQYVQERKINPNCKLTRGQIGCFDAHFRLWTRMVENEIEHAFIVEDDVGLHFDQRMLQSINQGLAELKELEHKHKYDIVFFGHKSERRTPFTSPHFFVPTNYCGMFAYLLTLQGAKILLRYAQPYTVPTDLYVMYLWKKHLISPLAMAPPLCFVTTLESDTRNIK
jgi:GR25 family glycosyltransferase involved in LPS biosynthesis